MEELISRQAVIDSMCELMRHWFGCDPKDEIREIKRELGKLPTIEPEQPQRMRGRWMEFGYPWFKCSQCGAVREKGAFLENFCPNCGADMREGQDG